MTYTSACLNNSCWQWLYRHLYEYLLLWLYRCLHTGPSTQWFICCLTACTEWARDHCAPILQMTPPPHP